MKYNKNNESSITKIVRVKIKMKTYFSPLKFYSFLFVRKISE